MYYIFIVCIFMFAFLGITTPIPTHIPTPTTLTSTITTTFSTTDISTDISTDKSYIAYAIKNITKNFCNICKCQKKSRYCIINEVQTLPFGSTKCGTGFILTLEKTSVNCYVVNSQSNPYIEIISGIIITIFVIGFLIWICKD